MTTVAIVGGGPAGLITAKEALACDLRPTVFESSSQIGGQWNLDSDTSAVWPSLYMNTSRRMEELSDFTWDQAVPPEQRPENGGYRGVFPHAREAIMYIDAMVDKFGVRETIKLNSRVSSISKTESGKWIVATDTSQEEFDHVVIATGRYITPNTELVRQSRMFWASFPLRLFVSVLALPYFTPLHILSPSHTPLASPRSPALSLSLSLSLCVCVCVCVCVRLMKVGH